MAMLTGLAKRHPLLGFFLLACGLSWWPWLLARLHVTVDEGILPFGPFLAALIMLALTGGRPAVNAWLGKITAWRIGLGWYALALLLPAAITAMSVGVNLFLGASPPLDAVLPGWGDLVLRFAFVLVFIGFGGEPAWRGYVLPHLLERRTALGAALMVALLYVLWHLPTFGPGYDFAELLPWLAAIASVSVVTAWLWLATDGNLLLPALLHATVTTAAFPRGWFDGAELVRLWWIWAGLWVAVAAIVVIANGAALIQPKPRRMMG